MMDLVYIIKNGDENEELKFSLRSIEKFAPEYDKIFIVGYKPNWLNNKISYIPTFQKSCLGGWINARNNIITACKSPQISADFILMNDDFILTRPIKDWHESLSKAKNTLDEQIAEWNKIGLISDYTRAFIKTNNLLFLMGLEQLGIKQAMNYELHIPMIINREKFLSMLNKSVINMIFDTSSVVLYRSLYGNICNIGYNELIKDVKLYKTDVAKISTEWISTLDGIIGSYSSHPVLNKFLDKNLANKSSFEL